MKPLIVISSLLVSTLYPSTMDTNTSKSVTPNQSFKDLSSKAFSIYDKSHSQAIDFLKEYYKKHPKQKQPALLLAKMLAWESRYKESLAILNSDIFANDEESILLKAKIEAWTGRYPESLKLLEYIIKHSKNQKRVWEAKKLKANIYMWNGKKQKAITVFEELKKSGFKDKEVDESLMILKGDIKPLIQKYEKLLSKDPKNQELIQKLAELNHTAKENKKAIKYYNTLLKENPKNIETYKSRGEIYLEMKQFYNGFGDWEYYANYLHKKSALYQLAQRYYWYGYYDAAISVLDDLKALYPDDDNIWKLRAKILKEKPRYLNTIAKNSAQKECKKNFTMANRLYTGGLYKDSLTYYANYINCKPDDYDAREQYAYALEKSGKYQKAAGEFYLIQWMKKTPKIIYHYAYNLEKSGQTDRAKEIYKELYSTLKKEPTKDNKAILKDTTQRLKEIKKKPYINHKHTSSNESPNKFAKTAKYKHGYVKRGPFGTFADKLDRSSSGKPLASLDTDQRRYSAEIDGDYFSDNNGVSMKSTGLSMSYRLDNGNSLYFFTGGFYISDTLNSSKERGKFVGIGLHGDKFSADIFADNGGDETNFGWAVAYNGDIGFTSLHASIDRRNLVYSRKTADSVDLMSTKFTLSGYKVLGSDFRGIWWSAAYEHIDDGNNVVTLQYDYSFYDHKLFGGDVIYYMVGWYMFNSQYSDAYYTPSKVDNTLLGIRYEHDISPDLRFSINATAGHSFVDKVNLYDGGVWIKNRADAPYEVSLGCNFNNGTGINSSAGYKSKECGARLTIKW